MDDSTAAMGKIEPMGSYMVRPVLQVLFDRNIKKYCIHI